MSIPVEQAPPYRGEGPFALWHVSENPGIGRFEPHHVPGHSLDEKLVWASDTRHLPLYWFPRDCPRATYWATSATTEEDVETFLDGDRSLRVHVVEPGWIEPMRSTSVVAYRLPEEAFERWDRFWISREPVEPLDLIELGDLVERHMKAAISLDAKLDLRALWQRVISSSLDFSGIRLRNASLVG